MNPGVHNEEFFFFYFGFCILYHHQSSDHKPGSKWMDITYWNKLIIADSIVVLGQDINTVEKIGVHNEE
jgi:hypothetical protein